MSQPGWPQWMLSGIPPIPDPAPSSTGRRNEGVFRRTLRATRVANFMLLALNFLLLSSSLSLLSLFSSMHGPTGSSHHTAIYSSVAQIHRRMTAAALRYTSTAAEANAVSSSDDTGEPVLRAVDPSVSKLEDMLDFYGVFGPSRSVPLIASAVSLPDSLTSVDFVDLLPPDLHDFYATPGGCLRAEPAPAPPAKLGGSSAEYVALLRRLVGLNMLDFRQEVKCVNGLFCVPKGDKQRLIIDARPANAFFVDCPELHLPTPCDLAKLRLRPRTRYYAVKCDLDNFYHRLRLPQWMVPYFGLPAVRAEDVGLAEQFGHGTLIHPCCRTLPMGWSLSTHVAQRLHMYQLTRPGSPLADFLPLGPGGSYTIHHRHVCWLVYIDDLVIFCADAARLQRLLDALLDYYASVGLVVKLSKVVGPVLQLEVLGLEFDGARHTIGLAPAKLRRLHRLTMQLLQRGTASALDMSVLVGLFVWPALARRPLLAVLNAVFAFMRLPSGQHILWPGVRRELLLFSALLPLMYASLSMPIHSTLACSDASSSGRGVTIAPSPAVVLPVLGKFISPSPFSIRAESASLFARHLSAVAWRVVDSTRWATGGSHINGLEANALLAASRWILSDPAAHSSHFFVFVDSLVVLSAVAKGRSSSPSIASSLRRLAALQLLTGSVLHPLYVNTHDNPADRPSRLF